MTTPFTTRHSVRAAVSQLPLRISLVAEQGEQAKLENQSVVLTGFVEVLTVQMLPLQIDIHAVAITAQPMAMTNYQPCASCYIGSPFAIHKADGGDYSCRGVASGTKRSILQTDNAELASDISEIPVIAPRFLYCRWLD
ncbi:hypothetical protein [Herminiimonas arsenitoxidans]|uniref:hypothetical protein n=1 Tax=Herminiimonas arsenitoxidans TaxID=1809410 RepID=UPI000970F985|nr:hypothetical protein [Herminiimonas arsenitoxidans]